MVDIHFSKKPQFNFDLHRTKSINLVKAVFLVIVISFNVTCHILQLIFWNTLNPQSIDSLFNMNVRIELIHDIEIIYLF